MSGDNLYENQGKRWCRRCKTARSVVSRARVQARKRGAIAADKKARPPDRFAALVGAMRYELAALPEDDRAVYYREQDRAITQAERDADTFARRRVTREQIGKLTGLADDPEYGTITQRLRRARREHAAGTASYQTMPLPDEDGTWLLARLALWRAAVWPKYSLGTPGRWERTHEDWAPLVAELVERYGRRLTLDQAAEELGIATNGPSQLTHRLLWEAGWHQVRPGTPDGTAEAAALESLRWDGLLTVAQVAKAFQVDAASVRLAVKEDRLTPALRERGRPLFSPGRLAIRKDGRPGPVDAGHPLAVGLEARRSPYPIPEPQGALPCSGVPSFPWPRSHCR